MEKLFSIILPVYNVAGYLDRSVSCVLTQSSEDCEIILVDDGSTDASGALCDAWAKKSEKIRVIHKENGGLASARNAGLDSATGRYVLLIDSDDYIEPRTLATLRTAIAQSAADIIRFDLIMHRAQGAAAYRNQYAPGLYVGAAVRDRLVLPILRDTGTLLLSACLHAYRRAYLNENGLRFVSERLVLSEDFLFTLCAFYCAKRVYITNELLYHYEMRDGSLTHSPKPRMFERYTKLYRHLKLFYRQQNAPGPYLRLIDKYFVYDLFYLNVVSAEYQVSPGHTWQDARRNVRRMLAQAELRSAARSMDSRCLPLKERVKTRFIRYGFEPGLAFAFRKRRNAT